MKYAWLIFIGFALFYTAVVFWFPLSDDFPPLWSTRNSTPRSRILVIHALFLCAVLSLLWVLAWREHSFAWLTRGTGFRYPAALQVFFVAVFMGIIERLWLGRGCAYDGASRKEGSASEAPEHPHISKSPE